MFYIEISYPGHCRNKFLQVVFRSRSRLELKAGADIFYPEPKTKSGVWADEKWLGSTTQVNSKCTVTTEAKISTHNNVVNICKNRIYQSIV